MLRYLLPGFALACALLILFAGALTDHFRSYETADANARLFASTPGQATPQPGSSDPQQGPQPAQAQPAQPQAAPQFLQRQVQTLRQEATALQEQLTRRSQELDQRTDELERRTRDAQAAQAAADDLRLRFESLRKLHQQEGDTKQRLAIRSEAQDRLAQAGDQGNQPVNPQQGAVESRQDEADRLRLVIDALRQRSRAGDGRPKTEEASSPRQQAKSQQFASKTPPQSDPPPKPTPPATAAPDAPSPAQQLMTARQWLAARRPDEARRLLAMVQTQLVLQPVTPDAPEARGTSQSAGDVGNAIRWLDLGAERQAIQAINQAMQAINQTAGDNNGAASVSTVRAWSGYPIGIYSGYSQPYDRGYSRMADPR